MGERPRNYGADWTRAQLILALDLYCRMPWGKINHREKRVQALAAVIERTPSSVARKLGNFGAFDPALRARNVGGLPHGSKLDREVWDEFAHDWGGLAEQAAALRGGEGEDAEGEGPAKVPHGPSERVVMMKQRLHQRFFRDAVLSSYENRCCVTGLPLPECLVAGHIIPWSVDEQRRADPTNGVCMSATFDRLFDAGLMTIEADMTLRVSERVRGMRDERVAEMVTARHGQEILLPTRFHPDPVCLEWHRRKWSG